MSRIGREIDNDNNLASLLLSWLSKAASFPLDPFFSPPRQAQGMSVRIMIPYSVRASDPRSIKLIAIEGRTGIFASRELRGGGEKDLLSFVSSFHVRSASSASPVASNTIEWGRWVALIVDCHSGMNRQSFESVGVLWDSVYT